jgi:hypothetical protein
MSWNGPADVVDQAMNTTTDRTSLRVAEWETRVEKFAERDRIVTPGQDHSADGGDLC